MFKNNIILLDISEIINILSLLHYIYIYEKRVY